MGKTCLVVWLMLFASALWVTGLTIGIIGAVKWTPLKPFLDNAKTSRCTLLAYQYTPTRCSKWGICLTAKWQASHPGLRDPTTTVNALIIEKEGLGYNDASKVVLKRKVGDVTSCEIDSRTETTGYFNKPGTGYFVELIIGWIFFFIGTIIWLFFFLHVCDVVSFPGMIKHMFRCSCSCRPSKSSSTAHVPNPLYTSATYNPRSDYSKSSESSGSSAGKDVAELEVIHPTAPGISNFAGVVGGTSTVDANPYAAAGAGSGPIDRTSTDSSSSDDYNYGAGAGVTN